MKLKGVDILVLDAGNELHPVLSGGGNHVPVFRDDLVGMNKIIVGVCIHRIE